MSGFYITAYVNAFGQSEEEARKQWTIALALVQNVLVQVAKAGLAADERR
jgi:predicted RNase H-like HicB family nuclease